jgi:hypothetical protein
MPSTPFGLGLTRLRERPATGQKNENTENEDGGKKTDQRGKKPPPAHHWRATKSKALHVLSIFHHFSLFEIDGQKNPALTTRKHQMWLQISRSELNTIIPAAGLTVKAVAGVYPRAKKILTTGPYRPYNHYPHQGMGDGVKPRRREGAGS